MKDFIPPAAAVLLLLAGCTGPRGSTCLHTSELAGRVHVQDAWAVPLEVDRAAGLREHGLVWFIATAGGATWVTNRDLRAGGEEGMTLPLNDRARDAAELGREAPVGDPVFGGITDMHPAAAQARECAAARRRR
jgi:hypothetical protein